MVDKNRVIEQLKRILQIHGTTSTVTCDSCFRTSSYSVNSEMEMSLRAFLFAIEQGKYDYAFERSNQDAGFEPTEDR